MRAILVALASLSVVACASTLSRIDECQALAGSYILDSTTCKTDIGLLKPTTVMLLPDDTRIVRGQMQIDVAVKECSKVVLQLGTTWKQFEGEWDGSRFTHMQAAEKQSTPMVLASSGEHTWSLETEGEDLLYKRKYSERGFIVVLPYYASREVTCRMRRVGGVS
ncbi:MAG TPA: hypothetical protein VGF69_24600 [Thermoanaerobaculia bacterium]